MLYPLLFEPVFQERIWGGRNLKTLYRKHLPAGVPIGESWEIVDRDEAQSVVANGPLRGRTLRWIMQHHGPELLGAAASQHGRFPLLAKILDAEDRLSLQVHPPPHQAAALGGEPKTEMWYITRARPGACLYVGLRRGVTRAVFEENIRDGSVADCFHKAPVQAGDAMFLPSGRVHAIGAGLVLFEIQQNSDTTYRVFDWNRVDAAGRPRPLHIQASLESIDFEDFEPEPIPPDPDDQSALHIQTLVEDPLFSVEIVTASRVPAQIDYQLRAPRILAVAEGAIKVSDANSSIELSPGQFCLVPAALGRVKVEALAPGKTLVAQPRPA